MEAEFNAPLATFVESSVDIAIRHLPDRQHALSAFITAMSEAFPNVDANAKNLQAAFDSLFNLASGRRGTFLSRSELLETIGRTVPLTHVVSDSLKLNIRSDRTAQIDNAVEIDASRFSASDRSGITQQDWNTELLKPVVDTATWAHASRYSRIELSGQFRLSTAFAVGWAFRSATGFEIDIPTRSGAWKTDESHGTREPALSWNVNEVEHLHNDRLIVAVGILRDPLPDVLKSVTDAKREDVMTLKLMQPIQNGREAQSAVQTIKLAVAGATSRLAPKGIQLFFVGPSALAVAMGHRWNGFPTTQIFEFDSTKTLYYPTVHLV